ncbi:SDR family oxidoreductase [Amycolatopsis cihanbeyliensis]|nr:NAD(P)H-binding protein [Amycolatopsis cihanbeyliensis]
MLLVTGATGTVGRHLIQHLRRAGQPVRALTRDPGRAELPDGVDAVRGDLADTATLGPAFDGVTAAHLINFGRGYQPLSNGRQIVDLAVRSGVRRVTILGGWQEGTLEPAVRDSTLEWTHLQPVEFMDNARTDWRAPLRADGVVREPYGDRRSAPVHAADIGAVAATALTTEGHAGQSYTLTGPEVLTPRDKIRILGEATGRELRFEELTPDQVRREWVERGHLPRLQFFTVFGEGARPAEMVELLLRLYGSTPEVGYTVTDAVRRVTGRPARSFAGWAAEHADEFRL